MVRFLTPLHFVSSYTLVEVARVLVELDTALKTNAEDRIVEYYLQNFFAGTNKLHAAFLKDVDELVNPFTQVSLGNLSFLYLLLVLGSFTYAPLQRHLDTSHPRNTQRSALPKWEDGGIHLSPPLT